MCKAVQVHGYIFIEKYKCTQLFEFITDDA